MAASTLRLFFALWPDPGTRAAIAALARDIGRETGGRAVAAAKVHLTLAFLGERPADMVPKLCANASAVEFSAFRLALDEVGCWRKTGIAWLGTSAMPAELAALQASLARALASLAISLDERPFAAHLTLARRIATPVRRRLAQPIDWRVASFALIVSRLGAEGAGYSVLESWPR